ncbi:MAG: Phage integrase family protein [Deltaproteobacteria bacterium]|nr:Phage integrase family protein [Deltaproteobacteria bacterium]
MVINLLFNRARKWGYIKNNPTEDIDRPKYEKSEINIMEPWEIKRFLEQAEKDVDHYRVAFCCAVETGLRAGELWGLQWGDIDWLEGKLHVRRSLWRGNFQTPKTKNSIRRVDISATLLTELKKWKLACPINKDDLIFPSPTGSRTNHENATNRYFRPILRRAGLEQVSFHSLRHTNASLRIMAGQHLKYMSKQLGHSSIKITLDRYGHLFKDSEFNKQQVGLLDQTLASVRNPLESVQEIGFDQVQEIPKQLNLHVLA